ncbi:hypothetical protein NDU88_005200 [Pleurodeles waltl]|uniref:Uncharacterized protein n=1 Tax=Pleurodeles waltl TaxID=8319 RepID=A0AAV7NNA5_PLEWA|nr:hypothetical protein NDU88_005200 [Pleurodeles waltl]
MRSGKIRKEYLTPQKPPQKRKKCCRAVNAGSATPPSPSASASAISATPLSSAANLSSSEIPKTYPSVALTPHPRSLDLRKSSLPSYFKKKPKLEFLVNGGEIKSELGQSTFTEPAVIDPLPTARGYSTTVAQVYCPALPHSHVFAQLAPQSEVSHPPPPVDQRAAPLLKHKPSPTIISSDHSLNPGERASFLVASPAAFHQLAGPDGQTADCHDSLQYQGIFLPSSPPAAQSIRNSTGTVTGALELVTEAKGASTSPTSSAPELTVPASSHPPCTFVQPVLVQSMSSGGDPVAQPPLSKREKKRLRKQWNSKRSQPSQGPSTGVRLSAHPEVKLPLQFQGAPTEALPPNSLQLVPIKAPLVGTTAQETDSPLKNYLISHEKGNPGSVLVSAAPYWGSRGSACPATTLSVSKITHGNMNGDALDLGSSNFFELPPVNRSNSPAILPSSPRTASAENQVPGVPAGSLNADEQQQPPVSIYPSMTPVER